MSLKKVFFAILSVLALAGFTFATPAFAADGAQLFNANCGSCHGGGANYVVAPKTLQDDAMKQYLTGYADDPEGAISYQIIHGKGSMPGFGRLKPDEVDAITAYVIEQAEKGW